MGFFVMEKEELSREKVAGGWLAARQSVTSPLFVFFASAVALVLGTGNCWWSKTAQVTMVAEVAFFCFVFFGLVDSPKRFFGFVSSWGYLVLVGVFLYLFRTQHAPLPLANGTSMVLVDYWWWNFLSMSVMATLLGVLAFRGIVQRWVLGGFCLAMTLLGLLFCVSTMFLEGHTYGGAVFNPFEKVLINRAGISCFLVFFPAFLISLLPDLRGKKLWFGVGVTAFFYALSIWQGLLHGSRTVVAILMVLVPALVFGLSLFHAEGFSRKVLARLGGRRTALLAVVVVGGFLVINFMSARPITFEILFDERFTWYLKAFVQQIFSAPLEHSSVPAQFGHPWFHNFFADVHRSSGFYALLVSFLLAGWVFVRAFQLQLLERKQISNSVILLIVFLIMNTSVTPEGEYQPFLLFLLLGGLVEARLRELRRVARGDG